MLSRKMKLMFAASLALLLCGATLAYGQDRDGDHDRGRDNRQHGWSQNNNGRGSEKWENRHGRDERSEANQSYRRPNGWRGNDGDRDDRYRGNSGSYRNGNNGYYGNNSGYYGQYGNNGYYGNSPYYGNNGGYYGNNGGYYGNNGGYYGNNGYGYGNVNQAYNIGLQDGLRDGANDRRTGHSYRPTQDDNYRNADRGYSSSAYGGNKQGYKNTYRQGYEVGYNRGYNSGGRGIFGF